MGGKIIKGKYISTVFLTLVLLGSPAAWAHGGGMGGGMMGQGSGMGGGMMGQGGDWMNSFGNRPSDRDRDYQHYQDRRQDAQENQYDQRREEWRRERDADHREIEQLHRQVNHVEQDLIHEIEKEHPDKSRMKNLRETLSDLDRQYNQRKADFEKRWGSEE